MKYIKHQLLNITFFRERQYVGLQTSIFCQFVQFNLVNQIAKMTDKIYMCIFDKKQQPQNNVLCWFELLMTKMTILFGSVAPPPHLIMAKNAKHNNSESAIQTKG